MECDKEEELLAVIKRLQEDQARSHAELVEDRRARLYIYICIYI